MPDETSAGETGGREAGGSPLCDRISAIADQLEASITDLRGLVGVSRPRVALAAAVANLRNIAELVLEQGSELDDERQRAETAERELAEMRERLGDTRVEWAVYWRSFRDHYEPCETEEEAREAYDPDDPTYEVRSRVVGEWKAAVEE